MFKFGHDHWAHNKQMFEDQFELDGDQFLYRRDQRGPPIRVSSTEKDRFVADYARRLKYSTRALIVCMLLLTALVVTYSMKNDSEPSSVVIYVGMGAMAVALISYTFWASAAPARELAGRMPVGRGRTRDEMKRVMIGRLTYGQIGVLAVAALFFPSIYNDGTGYLSGWNALWTAMGGAMLVIAAFAAIRKWREDHQDVR